MDGQSGGPRRRFRIFCHGGEGGGVRPDGQKTGSAHGTNTDAGTQAGTHARKDTHTHTHTHTYIQTYVVESSLSTLVQPRCMSRVLHPRGRMPDFGPGGLGSIPSRGKGD